MGTDGNTGGRSTSIDSFLHVFGVSIPQFSILLFHYLRICIKGESWRLIEMCFPRKMLIG